MKGEKFNIPGNRPRVLVAPLDWGLGHATRCIPIIFKLVEQNCEVIIAAEGAGKILLQKEFPGLTFIDLKGYRVFYSRNKFWMPAKLLFQFPKLIYRIYAERRWLKKTVDDYKIDAVVSDNRLGLSHKNIPCAYITHQLLIKTGNRFTERIAQKIHYRFINKYSVCWVPDAAGKINLAGELSHPAVLPNVPVKYLGPLSRFEKRDLAFKYDLCIILSGPEPQRTIFEEIIQSGLKDFDGNAVLIRGLPGESVVTKHDNPALEIKNHLAAHRIKPGSSAIKNNHKPLWLYYCNGSDRAEKKAILVPTPGQTEQEYLAGYLQQQKLFFCAAQKGFLLQDILKKAAVFNYQESILLQNDYKTVVEDFVRTLKKINGTGI